MSILLIYFSILLAGTSWLSWTSGSSCKWEDTSLKQHAWKLFVYEEVDLYPFCVSFHRAQQLKDQLYVLHLIFSEILLNCSWLSKWICWWISHCCVSKRDLQGNQESQEMKETSGLRSDFKLKCCCERTNKYFFDLIAGETDKFENIWGCTKK